MNESIVISTRIRLARNYEDLPFITKMTPEHAQTVLSRVKEAIFDSNGMSSDQFNFYTMDQLTKTQKQALVEKHLISPNMIGYGKNSGVVISSDEKISILINEEDHIRIQTLKDGYDLKGALELANKIDDLLESKNRFAFDGEFGYLTVCPTNVGTGLRASVMLHLPALSIAKQAGPIFNAATKLGIVSRGLYGEGSEAIGNFYQISNQLTLGITEEQAIEKLTMIVNQIIEKENEVTNILKDNLMVQDRIYRSYGILKNARMMPTGEYMNLISDVRLGINMGIITDINLNKLNEFLVKLQPANIMMDLKSDMTSRMRDEKRATSIRQELFQ